MKNSFLGVDWDDLEMGEVLCAIGIALILSLVLSLLAMIAYYVGIFKVAAGVIAFLVLCWLCLLTLQRFG